MNNKIKILLSLILLSLCFFLLAPARAYINFSDSSVKSEFQYRIESISKELKSFKLPFQDKAENYLKQLLEYSRFRVDKITAKRFKIEKINFPGKEILKSILGIVGWFFQQVSKFFFFLGRGLIKWI